MIFKYLNDFRVFEWFLIIWMIFEYLNDFRVLEWFSHIWMIFEFLNEFRMIFEFLPSAITLVLPKYQNTVYRMVHQEFMKLNTQINATVTISYFHCTYKPPPQLYQPGEEDAYRSVSWTDSHIQAVILSWRIKDQLDVTCYSISLLMCSTCFGH